MPKPVAGTFPLYFSRYIDKVTEDDLHDAFNNQRSIVANFFQAIPEEKASLAYAPGKWTLKELLQHIIDAERIFTYRALCIARKETISLPGFDENEYAENSDANRRAWSGLVEEMNIVRRSSEMLFESFSETTLNQSGLSNDHPATVNALGFILIGHMLHHIGIVKERYLV
jgi:hypothetical protein